MSLIATSLDYSVHTGLGTFYFSVSADSSGRITVSDVRKGAVAFNGAYPLKVHTEISSAIARLENIMAGISTVNGTVTLNNTTAGQVVFASPVANADFRVIFSIDDFIGARVTARSITGFSFELSAPYTGDIQYDIIF